MIEKMKNMEPLTEEEEARISRNLLIAILIPAAGVVGFMIWCGVRHMELGIPFYVLIGIFLLYEWLMMDVFSLYWKHGLAGKTDEQCSAAIKMALLGLLANGGLAFFLMSMNQYSIYGAVAYFLATMMKRKQRDIYEGISEDEDTADETAGTAEDENASSAEAAGVPEIEDKTAESDETPASDEKTAGSDETPVSNEKPLASDEASAAEETADVSSSGKDTKQ